MKRLLILPLLLILVVPFAFADNDEIPVWVKGVASFWVQGQITDAEFIEAIEFLIENKIIEISGYEKVTTEIITASEAIIIPVEPKEMILSVSTDKESYQTDEVITISGTVPNNNSDTVTIMITDSKNSIMSMAQVSSMSDGTYTYTINIKDYSLILNEDYTVQVQYNSEKIKTNFSLS